jgi:hypothetical protein
VALDIKTKDRLGVRRHVVGTAGQFHATGLAAPSRLDLGLDHDRQTKDAGGGDGVRGIADDPLRADRDAVLREELFGLILVQVHVVDCMQYGRACPELGGHRDVSIGIGT